jgi:protein-S-isoprenylcysteine O-methyltransferase Ste14
VHLKAVAFRFRVWIFAALYLLGFLAPWEWLLASRPTGSLWLAASTLLARTGWISLAASTFVITLAAFFFCSAGAALRLWGTAYLGGLVVQDSAFHGKRMVEAGPYRFLRNPLYLGTLFFSLGVSFLMPVTGALFFLLGIYFLQRLLISAEETFLAAQLGQPYRDYLGRVPALVPKFVPENAVSPARPHWLQAVLAEIYPVGFAFCFALFAWRYNRMVLIKCLLVCYGLSLIMRALKRSGGTERG